MIKSLIDKIEVTADVNLKADEPLNTSNIVISPESDIPGYTPEIIPNNFDFRSYFLDENITYNYSGNLTLVNDHSEVYDINIGVNEGQRFIYNSGDLNYYISGYYGLESTQLTHRFFKTSFSMT